MADTTKNYWAFISYSSKDKKWGKWLHNRLENYPIPKEFHSKDLFNDSDFKGTLKPCFRDRDELAGSTKLGPAILAALTKSRYLIVLCSKNSAQSEWVNKEIEDFKELHGDNNILALILDGEPNASSNESLPDTEECFPPALRYPHEPLAGDLRKEGDGKERGFLKILAGVSQIGFDDLYKRHERAQRKKRLTLGAAAATIIASLTVLTLFAFQQKEAANRQRSLAEKLRIEAQKEAAEQSRKLSLTLHTSGERKISQEYLSDGSFDLISSYVNDENNTYPVDTLIHQLKNGPSFLTPVSTSKFPPQAPLISDAYTKNAKFYETSDESCLGSSVKDWLWHGAHSEAPKPPNIDKVQGLVRVSPDLKTLLVIGYTEPYNFDEFSGKELHRDTWITLFSLPSLEVTAKRRMQNSELEPLQVRWNEFTTFFFVLLKNKNSHKTYLHKYTLGKNFQDDKIIEYTGNGEIYNLRLPENEWMSDSELILLNEEDGSRYKIVEHSLSLPPPPRNYPKGNFKMQLGQTKLKTEKLEIELLSNLSALKVDDGKIQNHPLENDVTLPHSISTDPMKKYLCVVDYNRGGATYSSKFYRLSDFTKTSWNSHWGLPHIQTQTKETLFQYDTPVDSEILEIFATGKPSKTLVESAHLLLNQIEPSKDNQEYLGRLRLEKALNDFNLFWQSAEGSSIWINHPSDEEIDKHLQER